MRIDFSESESFYKKLDSQIKIGKAIIVFKNEKLDEKSKLWPRLRRCKNWSLIEKELNNLNEGKKTPVYSMMNVSMAAKLTGGEIFLIGFISSLLAGLIFYGIYKGCKVRFKYSEHGGIELEIDPAK